MVLLKIEMGQLRNDFEATRKRQRKDKETTRK